MFGPETPMQPGDKVQVVTTGTIRRVGQHHGICFEVELTDTEYRDRNSRMVWLDSSEVRDHPPFPFKVRSKQFPERGLSVEGEWKDQWIVDRHGVPAAIPKSDWEIVPAALVDRGSV